MRFLGRAATRFIVALGVLLVAGHALATGGETLVYRGGAQGKVVFDGRLHAGKGYTCNDCHRQWTNGTMLFATQQRSRIDMAAHGKDAQCFACHDGRVAPNACATCHRGNTAAIMPVVETVRLHGAASVVDSLVQPAKAAVERATGYALAIDKSNAGKGLIDLVDGKCDAALASAAIPTLVSAAKAAGREIDASRLEMAVIKQDLVVFVVHPSNPVKSLTMAQLRDIHAGRVTNWKEVGGPDLAIEVVTDTLSSATRGLIRQAVLKDLDYAAGALAVNVETISDEVGKRPGAIGGLGAGFVKKDKAAVVQSDRIERPLALVTVGPPSEKVKRVIDALKAASAS